MLFHYISVSKFWYAAPGITVSTLNHGFFYILQEVRPLHGEGEKGITFSHAISCRSMKIIQYKVVPFMILILAKSKVVTFMLCFAFLTCTLSGSSQKRVYSWQQKDDE